MKISKLIVYLLFMPVLACQLAAAQSLDDGFRNVSGEARPQVWWHWIYGNITREGITSDLELMQRLGIGGVTQFHNAFLKDTRRPDSPRGPVRFMSDEYRELVNYSLKECERLGMTMGLQICDGFATAGGPWVTPEQGMRGLDVKISNATGGKRFEARPPKDTINILAYRGTGKSVVPKSVRMISPGSPYIDDDNDSAPFSLGRDEFIDITPHVEQDGMLRWTPPEGNWAVLMFFDRLLRKTNHPASPEGHGLECDKLSGEAADVVYDHVVGPLIEDAGDLAGKTLDHVLIDSWECGYQSWTKDFVEEFRSRRGYDPTLYLPVLAKLPVSDKEISNRFLVDYRVTLDDLLANEFYGHIRDRLNKKGMKLEAEVIYGWKHMFGNPIRLYGVCDVPMNEFWIRGKKPPGSGRVYTGFAAAAGHVYGKRIIKDESFTVGAGKGDFSLTPAHLKAHADRVLCRGTNKFVLHTSVHQPDDSKPGWTHGWNGVNFHRGNTWWLYADGFVNYLGRCSYMLQQDLFVADVCHYVGYEDTYSSGYGDLTLKGLPEGYRADHCDNSVLLERMDVKDGRIVLPDGMSYAVLLLADKKTMAPEVLKKVDELVRKGATVIGPKPESAPGLENYPECDRIVRDLADQLWIDHADKTVTEARVGNGRMVWGASLAELLKQMELQPDFTFKAPRGTQINFIHRQNSDVDIFFVANSGQACIADCWFRIAGEQPELFDPMTGEISDIAIYEEQGGRTRIPLRFEAQGARFIVFRKPSKDHIVELNHRGAIVFAPGKPIGEMFESLSAEFFLNSGSGVSVTVKDNVDSLEWIMASGKKGTLAPSGLPKAVELKGPWSVEFESDRGAPARIQMNQLSSWTEHEARGVRYFSGVGTYKKSFAVPSASLGKNSKLILDLGDVRELAEVVVNGQSAGTLWRPPFEVDISHLVRSGKNELEVRVVNTWANRLIGDKTVPLAEQVCRIISPDPKWYTAESALPESGLLGPVVLRVSRIYKSEH
ncbi:glycosyl hydrolase [Pontiella sulfatireligans]|uniref:Uncharacterized protein n=1 Tax=Pontiella sulfatireligans TaxID=2750658 RepID=A0A6C2UJH7_9BACT|nr:glycosyl hydrolase [Pontiella sulfatireligans]VGO19356.1 hypothetical protein SCARR_01414 [Pontiella sulfatireligans]